MSMHAPPVDTATDAAVVGLMRKVGDRVRAARTAKGLTRQRLSERSGVSPRYLAQLEAGSGNISLAILKRISLALDISVDGLIAEAPFLDLFHSADPKVQAQVLRLLQEGSGVRLGRVCLVGLRGAGKSTLGAALGAALGVTFVELNRRIEDGAGMAIGEIMALYGQDGYRRLEADALDHVIATPEPLILAVGGGIVFEDATYGRLLDHFHTVWLRAAPEEHMERVRAQGDTRPMAGNPQAMAHLKSILSSRAPAYARAEAQLDTSGQSVETSLADLLALIDARGFLRETR